MSPVRRSCACSTLWLHQWRRVTWSLTSLCGAAIGVLYVLNKELPEIWHVSIGSVTQRMVHVLG